MTFADAQAAIVAGLKEGERLYGVVGRSVPAIDRENTPEAAVALVEEMIAHRVPETIGLGIDYRETAHEPENFWKAFVKARQAGFRITIHAGEFGEHWRNVETSMELLKADRIDHGYTIIDNPALMADAKARNMTFAVVPTNSYYLRTFSDEEWAVRHPIRKMVENGLKVFPNSDDPTMHQVSISEAWMLMFNWLGFTLPQLKEMLANAICSAWVDESVKNEWRRDWLAEFDELAASLPPLDMAKKSAAAEALSVRAG